jgi:hypothetical protein
MVDRLSRSAGQIEATLHEKPTFQREWGNNWSRLYVEKPGGKMTEELKLWAAEKMYELIELLQPELDRIRTSEQ